MPRKNEKADPKPEAKSSATQHQIQIDGKTVQYTATAGWLILENDEEEPIARFGYTAYTRTASRTAAAGRSCSPTTAGRDRRRSGSTWDSGSAAGRWSRTKATRRRRRRMRVDNEYSIIDVTDLVMVDPVGTGFSKPLGEAKGEDFWGVDQDIRSVGSFIKEYVSLNGRWASPKYILGESYGGIRTAGLVWHLQSVHGMNFNGVVVVSPFLDMGSGIDGGGIDLPHVLYLPTLAATAWYHDAIPNKPDLETFHAEVERFAYDEYAPALLKGYTIGQEEKEAVAAKLAAYTGTSSGLLAARRPAGQPRAIPPGAQTRRAHDHRPDRLAFHRSVGQPAERGHGLRPVLSRRGTGLHRGVSQLHARRARLRPRRDLPDHGRRWHDWDWEHRAPNSRGWAVPWANLRGDLAMALTMNPGLHLLVQQGYYDLATPTLATKHDLDHLDITPEARERIRLALYEAGHMMYLHEESRRKFRDDLAQFVLDTDRL